MKLTVIVCTYNPTDYVFESCIESIKKACLFYAPFEILVIDNNSNPSIEDKFKKILSFHKEVNFRLINEKEQGLTPARLRGIEESKGDILLYIDDDNFIKENYFQEVIEIANKYPHIGSFSGQVLLRYETEPEPWVHQYSGLLVSRNLQRDYWSNVYECSQTVPCGAGLVVLKKVADYYLQLNLSGKRPILLDRSKNSLLSGGDNDLAYCAIDIGLGLGLFKNLELIHYIPKSRTSLQYLTELTKWIAASSVVLNWYRNIKPPNFNFKSKVLDLYYRLTKSKISFAFHVATRKGEKIGKKIIEDYENSTHR